MVTADPNGTFLDKAIGTVKGPVQVIQFLNDHLANMDKMMMAEGDRRAQEDLPLIKEIFQNIHDDVYEWGRKTALTTDFLYYIAKNATDGKLALGKFAGTAAVIDWRCELDQERRTVHPTVCKNETAGWADWKVECDTVIDVLTKLIPTLESWKSFYWAHEHQRVSYLANSIMIIELT